MELLSLEGRGARRAEWGVFKNYYIRPPAFGHPSPPGRGVAVQHKLMTDGKIT